MSKRKRRKSREGSTQTLQCGEHGATRWLGTICCAECGRVWQIDDEHAPRYAPEVCACGVQLAPTKSGGGNYSARPICTRCYVGVVRTGGVRGRS